MPLEGWEHEDATTRGNGNEESYAQGLLARAQEADALGRHVEALHLFLAAYEHAQDEFQGSFLFDGHPALAGLRRSWDIACTLEDHNLAAHVLELLEPYLTLEELTKESSKLEKIALGGLVSGLASRSSMKEVADLITRDFAEAMKSGNKSGLILKARDAIEESENHDEDTAVTDNNTGECEPLGPGSCRIDDLHGFDQQLEALLRRGVFASGEDDDFLRQMSLQHGIEALPSRPVLVFRSPAREDADRLMLAVAAESKKPTVRMRVDDNTLAGTVLCVIASNGYDPRTAMAQNGMGLPDVLVLEGIDMWGSPQAGIPGQGFDDEMQMGMTKGALKALAFIRAAIENPKVTVYASATGNIEDAPWLASLFGQPEYFDVEAPNDDARDDIWNHLMDAHPSLSALDRFELVRLSSGMFRCDIESAAQEAVQQAFDESLSSREYRPVTRGNVLDKIAAYQPLDSNEYQEIENTLVEDLLDELELLDATSDVD